MKLAEVLSTLYALSLHCYPREFRDRFGVELQQTFRDRCRDTFSRRSPAAIARFGFVIAHDWFATFLRERYSLMTRAFFTTKRIAFVTAVVVASLGLSTTALQAYVIPTPSMESSLRVGDHILVNKLVHNLQRGDLAVFRYPVDPEQTFIKRVIGLPGDHIRLENKQVIRNGETLDEAYVVHGQSADNYRDNFPANPSAAILPGAQEMLAKNRIGNEVVVPPGSLFVLGDNRDHSLDSRYWGFVPQESIVGRVWMVYWRSGAKQ